MKNHGHESFVLAARPGLEGPEIDLLERQNKAFERITEAEASAIVYIRTEQIVKTELSPFMMDPSFRQFFGHAFP